MLKRFASSVEFGRFVKDDQGQDLIEYLLLGSFISLVALLGATAMGTQVNNWYQNVAQWVDDNNEIGAGAGS